MGMIDITHTSHRCRNQFKPHRSRANAIGIVLMATALLQGSPQSPLKRPDKGPHGPHLRSAAHGEKTASSLGPCVEDISTPNFIR